MRDRHNACCHLLTVLSDIEFSETLLDLCPTFPADLGRTCLVDRRDEGMSIIIEECKILSRQLPEYNVAVTVSCVSLYGRYRQERSW